MSRKRRSRYNEKMALKVLLDLIAGRGNRFKGDYHLEGWKIYLSLGKFFHEVFDYVKRGGMVRYFLPESAANLKTSIEEKSSLGGNLQPRIRTVRSFLRKSDSLFLSLNEDKFVPFIRLSGSWLEKYGFKIGSKYLVYAEDKQLIIREVGICVEYHSDKEENKIMKDSSVTEPLRYNRSIDRENISIEKEKKKMGNRLPIL
jgi:hypothetical protein